MKTKNLNSYIAENYKSLQKAVIETKRPLFDGVLEPKNHERLVKILASMGKNMPLLPLQARKIGAILASLNEHNRAIYSGDTGIGKTITGVALAYERAVERLTANPNASFNAFVVAPPHLVNKWANEAKKVTKGVIDVNIVIVKSRKDIESLTKKGEYIKGFNFFVISKNKNSLSVKCKQVFHTKRREHIEEVEAKAKSGKKEKFTKIEQHWHYTCPCCGGDLQETTLAKAQDGVQHEADEKLSNKKIKKCKNCGDSIMQPTGGKMSPAEFIARYGKTECIDLLLVDEIHEEKAKDTLRSKAFGQLTAKSKQVVGLTGTFLGGYASHSFFTLFRMFPSLFIKDLYLGWDDLGKFIEEFGGSEKLYQLIDYDEDTGVIKHGRCYGQKERADLSPRLLDVLLPMIVFARLDEMKFIDESASLPKYTELSHLVEHDEVFIKPQQEYLFELTKASSYELKNFDDRRGFGKLKVDALLVPDMPYKNTSITLMTENGETEIRYDAPTTREEYPLTNKERKLIELVNKALAEDKKVLVYHDFVNSGLRENLMEILKKHSSTVRVEELRSNISADKREAYLKALDCDVLITNPELVKTGLDLLEYPTIIFYEQSYSSYNVFTLRQAAKRAWRIGQTVECEVHSIAYAGTMQQKALSLIGSKMNISQGVEGRLSTGDDIASEADDENLQIAMARELLKNEKIDNAASSSSKTLDLNARDWDAFELFYLEHLNAYKANPEEYEALIPKTPIVEVEPVVEALKEEILEEIEDEEEIETEVEITTKPTINKKALLPTEEKAEENDRIFFIADTVKVGRVSKKVTREVSAAELATIAESKGRVQLSLF